MALTAKFVGVAACFLLVNVCISSTDAAPDKMVCYLGSWAGYRVNEGSFAISDIPSNLCTHLIYAFVTTTDTGLVKIMDPWNDLTENFGKGNIAKFNKLKAANPKLKTLVAMGGWGEGSSRYSQIFSQASLRKTFALSAVSFLQKYGFDGFDLDWEYPVQRGGSPADKANFVELIKTMRVEFDKYGFLLTAAVAAAEFSVVQSYDVPSLGKYLDFINVMAYDFHGYYEKKTGHNAPLFISKSEINTMNAGLNVDASIKAWIKLGAPSQKLILGVGLYGRSFTLTSTQCAAPNCACKDGGNPGPFTQEVGMLGYNEICKIETTDKTVKISWDSEALVPYLVSGDQWVSYDNKESAQLKIDYIRYNNLGGAMVWSIDTDDFRGSCGNGKYPILTVLSNGIKGSATSTATTKQATTTTQKALPTTPPTTTTQATTTTTKILSTTTKVTPTTAKATPTTTKATPTTTKATTTTVGTPQAPGSICESEGLIRDPTDCQKFYFCTLDNGVLKTSKPVTCGGTLVFDTNINACNYRQFVTC